MPGGSLAVVLLMAGGLWAGSAAAVAAELPPGGTFIDDDGSTHEGSIEAIYAAGITVGCDERRIRYCPERLVTRGEMAAFLARALALPASPTDHFSDDEGNPFEADINRIAEAGITLGCNPPEGTDFCPTRTVIRAEMASFLVRSFPDRVPESAPDAFVDDDSSSHEANINRIATARITLGCNPPANDRYCPGERVTRAQMASFLVRALGLDPIVPPPQFPIELVSRFTTYFDCCQDRVINIRTIARAVDGYVVMPGEVFSVDRVVGPTTEAKGYVPAPYLQDGQGMCCAVGGGVSQFGTTIHNAVFWGGYEVVSHRPHSAWITRYPLGIEATLVYSSIDYKFENDTVTPVYIQTSTTSTSVTVELWGYNGDREVRGYHPRGYRSSVITVVDSGDATARRVTARVTGDAPGTVRIVRTITQGGVATSQTWYWTYLPSS